MMKSMTNWLALHALILLSVGCASGYKQFYTWAQGTSPDTVAAMRAEQPPANPAVERARPAAGDAILDSYARRAYVMIGSSMFNSGTPESEESALRQAREVRADLLRIT